MASNRHLAKLKEGAEAWNGWRLAEPSARPDLQGISLSLGEKQWGETNGGPINLSRTLLRDANLRHATLNKADLSGASLIGADLSGARLQRADLRNADLTEARLDEADLEEALLDGADLSGADLRSVRNLKPSQIEAARGDARTLLPSRFITPRAWMTGPRRSDFYAAPATTAKPEKPKWSGTFVRAPATASAQPRASWVSGFGKPAADAPLPASSVAQKGSFVSAFVRPDAPLPDAQTPASSTAQPAPAPPRASWAATLAKSAAPAIAVASAASAAASQTAGYLKSSVANSVANVGTSLAHMRIGKAASGEAAADGADSEQDAAPASAADPEVRRKRFSDALERATEEPREPIAADDADADADAVMVEASEGPDPRWIAKMARAAGATPVEEMLQRGKSWIGAKGRQSAAGLALLNPLRAAGALEQRLAALRRAKAEVALPDATSPASAPGDEVAGDIVVSGLGAAAGPKDAAPLSVVSDDDIAGEVAASRRSRWAVPLRSTAVQIPAATIVALVLVGGAVHLIHARQTGPATLNENLPLSAVVATDEPERVSVAKGPAGAEEIKEQRAAPLATPTEQVAQLKAGDPQHSIEPAGVSATVAPLKPENLPETRQISEDSTRAAEKGTQVALATSDKMPGEAVKATDAQDTTTVAQANVRQHGELSTSTDVSDPATPLVAAPPTTIKSVPPVKLQLLPKAPPLQATPQAAPQASPQAPEPAPGDPANKLSFAGQDLSALQKAKKPPATPVEYLKEPTKSIEWIETFIKKFYLSSAALSDADIKKIYSDPLEYFGEKNVSPDHVAQEMIKYYAQWPKRHYKLVPGSIKIEWVADGVADVSFLYDFEVSAPHKEPNKGRGRGELTLDLSKAPGHITREDGQVLGAN